MSKYASSGEVSNKDWPRASRLVWLLVMWMFVQL